MINRFAEQYGLEVKSNPIGSRKPKPVITLEGFTNPIDVLELTAGLSDKFTWINPNADIVTMESQQIEDAIAGYKAKSVFMFTPSKPGIFALGKAVLDGINKPHQTLFVISESDMDYLKSEGEKADSVITLLKDQKMGLFNNVAEARGYIEKGIDGTVKHTIDGVEHDIETKDTIVGAS